MEKQQEEFGNEENVRQGEDDLSQSCMPEWKSIFEKE